ncbi:MAG TPA: hypothetical protein VHZ51_06175 [Ktedonobacteraceae bacterium]|nr:hypothetical protein [Ktedonobacteraceae bacterium]
MSQYSSKAEKIIASVKGLQAQLQPGEEPLLSIPGYWDNGRQAHSIACEIVVTNQRLLGYYLVTFPRQRLFLDALPLANIRAVTLREKNFEPVFRELLVDIGDRKVYIRAPQKKIEALTNTLRNAIEAYATKPQMGPMHEEATQEEQGATHENQLIAAPSIIYSRQAIRRRFEGSPLSVAVLLAGGIFCEVIGILLWSHTGSAQIGLPLIFAGVVAWGASIFVRRHQQ